MKELKVKKTKNATVDELGDMAVTMAVTSGNGDGGTDRDMNDCDNDDGHDYHNAGILQAAKISGWCNLLPSMSRLPRLNVSRMCGNKCRNDC